MASVMLKASLQQALELVKDLLYYLDMNKKPLSSHDYYKKSGLDKVLLIHLSSELYEKIKRKAEEEERPMETTGRRIWEEYFKKGK